MHYFAALSMKKKNQIPDLLSKVSAICMILALLWLTVSAPFVMAAQEELAKQAKTERTALPFSEEESNPFANSTEEKAPSSTSFSEEYIHDHHEADHLFLMASQYHINQNAGTYIAFHGELLVPPPNKA
jgi:hypothetical protein